MADNVAKYGLRPYRSRSGSGNPAPERRFLATAYGGQPGSQNCGVQVGDPMTLVNDGSLAFATAGSGAAISHVVVGIEQYYDGTVMRSGRIVPYQSGAYSTNLERQTRVLAMRIEDWIWEIDCDDNTTATTLAGYQAFINENADLSYAGASAPNANPRLDISTHATTASLQFRIQGVSDTVHNQDFSGVYVKLLVTINKSSAGMQAATTIAGV